jgi:hypothetical protein
VLLTAIADACKAATDGLVQAECKPPGAAAARARRRD